MNAYSGSRITSVILLWDNAESFAFDTVKSILAEPECLEVLVTKYESSESSLVELEAMAKADLRLKIVCRNATNPADALNKAFRSAQGSLIGWLNANDLYPRGALARAAKALKAHPNWLMVYGEANYLNSSSGLCQRYPTLPPSIGIQGFRSHCYVCQQAAIFRRSMAVMLGPFNPNLNTAFDLDFLLRAFTAFPHRIGYIPHQQASIHLPRATKLKRQCIQTILETTALIAHHCGSASAKHLHNYALDLQAGRVALAKGETLSEHLATLAKQVEAWVEPGEFARFINDWLLDPATAAAIQAAEQHAAAMQLTSQMPVRLLQALHQELQLYAEGPSAGPHQRLWQAIQTSSGTYPLLKPLLAGHEHRLSSHELKPFVSRPFGINLIGHARNLGGNGEDVRMAARALQAAGVPCCVIDYPALQAAAGADHSLTPLICSDPTGGPYAFNLICLSAQIQARWHLQKDVDPLRERYSLAAWPWETSRWPGAWLPLLEMVDEIWPASRFTAAALKEPAAAASLPLQLMPMAAEITNADLFRSPAMRRATRSQHGLPPEGVLFVCAFDFNSTAIRKNPMAALETFQKAFPLANQDHEVFLVIKTFRPQGFNPEWHWLQQRAAEDSRIFLLTDSLDRDKLLALYGCCDVFLSLHRSEGYGRNLAEALQLGLDVIASDYGGNTDFCTGQLAHPVRCREVPIPPGAYPCSDGHVWGEPDLDHAAVLMRQLAAKGGAKADPMVLVEYHKLFSLKAAGARYRSRLEELWSKRHELANRLRWRAETKIYKS